MAAAARAYGGTVLAAPGDPGTAGPRALGRDLLRLVFGAETQDRELPAPLAGLIASPDGREALITLEVHVEERVEEDPGLEAALAGMLASFYRQQFDSGDGQALAELGSHLWWDDPAWARAAFERAVEAGNQRALIDLAKLLDAVLRDRAGALLAYGQAARSADPDVAAEALVELGHLRAMSGDALAARAAYQQAIGTRHPHWAPAATVSLGHLLQSQLGDDDGAQGLFRQAIASGDGDLSAHAFVLLATLLNGHGDVSEAKEAWQQAIDAGTAPWAEIAFSDLVNVLSAEGDLDGARAAHRIAVETGNPDAPHALVVIGNLLKERGDTEGARAAWRQAIDTGYGAPEFLLDLLSPPDEAEHDPDDDDDLADLPPGFQPGNIVSAGIEVLNQGLPPLPGILSYQMAIPMAWWTTDACAVVLFLTFSRHRAIRHPMATQVTYTRTEDGWTPDSHFHGTSFSHNPIASPDGQRDLGGQAMVTSGGSRTDTPAPGHLAAVWHGRAAPAVRQIALIQDGHEDQRPLQSHFGAWVICTEQPSAFHVVALDENGAILADIT